MFEDSFARPAGGKRKAMSVLISAGVQVFLVIVLVLIPLIYTEALPGAQLMTFLVAPPPPPPPRARPRGAG